MWRCGVAKNSVLSVLRLKNKDPCVTTLHQLFGTMLKLAL